MFFKTSTVGGLTFHTLLNDQIISKSLELYGEWSFGEVQILARLLPQNAHVIELGSNIGSHTVFLAKSICRSGTIYAFEPRRLYFQTLCANLVTNSISNVYAYQQGAAEQTRLVREGAVPSQIGMNAGAYAIGDLSGDEESIELIALDDRLDEFKPITLIKADIEGYELAALTGAKQLLVRDRPILYLEANQDPKTPDLLRFVENLGYSLWWHMPPWFRPNNRGGAMTNIFGAFRSWNIIASPNEKRDVIEQKLLGLADIRPVDNPDWHPEQK